MDFTKPIKQNIEPDFTKPAAEYIRPEAEEQPDFSQPSGAKNEPSAATAPEDEAEDQPRHALRKRALNTEPQPANHIRVINTARWKQEQAASFKHSSLNSWR